MSTNTVASAVGTDVEREARLTAQAQARADKREAKVMAQREAASAERYVRESGTSPRADKSVAQVESKRVTRERKATPGKARAQVAEVRPDQQTRAALRESLDMARHGATMAEAYGWLSSLGSEADLKAQAQAKADDALAAAQAAEHAAQVVANASEARRSFVVAAEVLGRVGKGREYVSWRAVADHLGITPGRVSQIRAEERARQAQETQVTVMRTLAEEKGLEDTVTAKTLRKIAREGDDAVAQAMSDLSKGKAPEVAQPATKADDLVRMAERVLNASVNVDGDPAQAVKVLRLALRNLGVPLAESA